LGDLGDALAIADRIHDLQDQLHAHLASHVNHEADEGAHAAAFAAHDQSPGVVEDAEDLAGEILETATDTADELIEAIQDTGTETLAVIADASETAVEVPEEVVTAPEPVEAEPEPEEPQSAGERAPSRQHILHRRVIG
jgi:cell division septum initiation protein DivIVA